MISAKIILDSIHCKRCSEDIEITRKRKWQISHGRKKFFCSHSCSNIYHRGGIKKSKKYTQVITVKRLKNL